MLSDKLLPDEPLDREALSSWDDELLPPPGPRNEETDDEEGVASSVAGGDVEWIPLKIAYDDEDGSGLVALLLLLVLNNGVLSFRIGLGRLGYCGDGSSNSVCCLDGDFLSLQ